MLELTGAMLSVLSQSADPSRLSFGSCTRLLGEWLRASLSNTQQDRSMLMLYFRWQRDRPRFRGRVLWYS
jgi:hypothetical protein